MVIRLFKLHLQGAVAAVQFLTRLPVPVSVPFDEAVLSRSVSYYPLAGGLIGGIIAVCYGLLELAALPQLPSAVLLLALWLILSGGLHLDGWMDTADGLLSHRSRERMLEIMKDSRVGAMGVLAAVLLLLLKFAVLAELYAAEVRLVTVIPFLISIPVWSRWWMSAAIVCWPGARAGEGIGSKFQGARLRHVGLGFVIAAAITGISGYACGIAGIDLVLLIAVPALLTTLFGAIAASWMSRKLGGLTGDTYGALNEWIEMLLLFVVMLDLTS
ncbi:adenosylcobinamide-GDP ribazoletransferase [Paenibacillus sp. GCM10023252]|uniref:adenosylcobinamide-GDP ribazoletransferase n=1 Tax=Paenibacillus sp. GCM10023252 TaxID=3252649 RepID=UPI00360D8A47